MVRRALSASPLLLLIAQGVMMGGCAETVQTTHQGKVLLQAYYLDADDRPTLRIAAAPGVMATDMEKDHFARLLSDRLGKRRIQNVADGKARQCEVHVLVTRLDKSGTLARGLWTGPGVVHLDASVLLTPAGGGDSLNAFNISKTLGWRGNDGPSEGLEDLELAFADGIAAALTNQPAEAD